MEKLDYEGRKAVAKRRDTACFYGGLASIFLIPVVGIAISLGFKNEESQRMREIYQEQTQIVEDVFDGSTQKSYKEFVELSPETRERYDLGLSKLSKLEAEHKILSKSNSAKELNKQKTRYLFGSCGALAALGFTLSTIGWNYSFLKREINKNNSNT